jgi:lipoprotein-anchoring transpeptidase ErfK/SrfK
VLLALLLGLTIAQHVDEGASGRHRSGINTRGGCRDPLAYQVLLDRRGFSSGVIDGVSGPNLARALAEYQRANGLEPTGRQDCATWNTLSSEDAGEILAEYTVTQADADGPFLARPLPDELPEQAALDRLSYQSLIESLSERFHASPQLLARLNEARKLAAGARLKVPAVTPFDDSRRPQVDPEGASITIRVSRGRSILRAERSDGSIAFVAPVSSGSTHDPLPIGSWKVTGVSWLPVFHYNPELFWDAEPGHSKAAIKAGPNNPAGVVWVDINVPHYGLHGTPTPNLVGHAQSHGCVRLTNWDAARLASLVRPGTPVVFDP